jgi:acyl-[acyl-carrier-protein]-phospholipid O-acyltransferase/long-chain-fatty-acid--[acyl-carrier-protein] ligase
MAGTLRHFAGKTLFDALVDAASQFDDGRPVIEDATGGSSTYRRLLTGARVLARRFAAISRPGERIALLLPNANAVAASFFALQSAGRVPAMLNYTAGPATVVSACRTIIARTVISSRAFIEKAGLSATATALEQSGLRIVWLEDMGKSIGMLEKGAGAVMRNRAIGAPSPEDPALILFTSGTEGDPKGVVLSHANLLANCEQVARRIEFSAADKLFNVLPVFHSFGMLGGMILPLVYGVRLYLYPSPLHYKIIPQAVAKTQPTILFGTDTFLTGYARTAKESDFSSIRLVVAGAEAVREETRKVWAERFGAVVLEGYGMTEASPVVAVNTLAESRAGSVGKTLPGIETRIEPVEGIERGGKLLIRGPNVMLGYMQADTPGVLRPLADGWHDSGDIVEIDEDGFLAIRGRIKRFAKIAGEMVSLGAVELMVQRLWPEENHAVVAVPDKRKGERVVLVTTAKTASRDALVDAIRKEGVSELMVPNLIIQVAEIPVLGSGKTDYPGATKIALQKAA